MKGLAHDAMLEARRVYFSLDRTRKSRVYLPTNRRILEGSHDTLKMTAIVMHVRETRMRVC